MLANGMKPLRRLQVIGEADLSAFKEKQVQFELIDLGWF
jgi:hypothetical protein